jgi:peptidyl-prolyl cis-trans isomerase D
MNCGQLTKQQIAKYGQPEERSASHILIKLPLGAAQTEVDQAQTKAQQIADEVRSGAKTFDQVLQEFSLIAPVNGKAATWVLSARACLIVPPLRMRCMPLKSLAKSATRCGCRLVSHVSGWTSITPAQVKPFEEVRETIAQELRRQQAENRFYEITQTLANWATNIPTVWNRRPRRWINDSGKQLVQSPGRRGDR